MSEILALNIAVVPGIRRGCVAIPLLYFHLARDRNVRWIPGRGH
jgi:hypothetical protein